MGSETRANLRCKRCNKLLAEIITSPWRITCERCHAVNKATEIERLTRAPISVTRQ